MSKIPLIQHTHRGSLWPDDNGWPLQAWRNKYTKYMYVSSFEFTLFSADFFSFLVGSIISSRILPRTRERPADRASLRRRDVNSVILDGACATSTASTFTGWVTAFTDSYTWFHKPLTDIFNNYQKEIRYILITTWFNHDKWGSLKFPSRSACRELTFS